MNDNSKNERKKEREREREMVANWSDLSLHLFLCPSFFFSPFLSFHTWTSLHLVMAIITFLQRDENQKKKRNCLRKSLINPSKIYGRAKKEKKRDTCANCSHDHHYHTFSISDTVAPCSLFWVCVVPSVQLNGEGIGSEKRKKRKTFKRREREREKSGGVWNCSLLCTLTLTSNTRYLFLSSLSLSLLFSCPPSKSVPNIECEGGRKNGRNWTRETRERNVLLRRTGFIAIHNPLSISLSLSLHLLVQLLFSSSLYFLTLYLFLFEAVRILMLRLFGGWKTIASPTQTHSLLPLKSLTEKFVLSIFSSLSFFPSFRYTHLHTWMNQCQEWCGEHTMDEGEKEDQCVVMDKEEHSQSEWMQLLLIRTFSPLLLISPFDTCIHLMCPLIQLL